MKIKTQNLECLFNFHKQYVWKTCRKSIKCVCSACGQQHPDIPVLKTRIYKTGYILRDRLYSKYDNSEVNTSGSLTINPKDYFVIQSVYNLNGDYIGDKKTAHRLCVKYGIKPEKASLDHNVCSIGFSEKDQKWFGWSHRALFGFKIGDTVKNGDCGYKSKTIEDEIESLIKWYSDRDRINVKAKAVGNEIHVSWEYTGERTNRKDLITGEIYYIKDIQFGKGEWIAQTLEDCKEMAIDFAEGVS